MVIPYTETKKGWLLLTTGNEYGRRYQRMLAGGSEGANIEIVKQKVSDFMNRISGGVMDSFLGLGALVGDDKVKRLGEIKAKFDLMKEGLDAEENRLG